jgi:acetyltransferase-like isoleucine patch superfamily enzyme
MKTLNFFKALIAVNSPPLIDKARKTGVKVGNDCRFVGTIDFGSEPYLIEIGNHVSLTNVTFVTHDGGVWVFRELEPNIDVVKPIIIGNNVFIGHGVVILPGVTVGNNVVIGAGSIVTKDIAAGLVVAGIPAKKVKTVEEYRKSLTQNIVDTKQLSPFEKKAFLLEKYNIG